MGGNFETFHCFCDHDKREGSFVLFLSLCGSQHLWCRFESWNLLLRQLVRLSGLRGQDIGEYSFWVRTKNVDAGVGQR